MESEGVDFIIQRALAADEESSLWIISLGACADVVSAWMKRPDIARRVVFFWHGRTQFWPEKCWSFNAYNDLKAVRLLFKSDLPLMLFDTGTHLVCPMAESEEQLKPCGDLGSCLHEFRLRNPALQSPKKGFFDLGDIAALLDSALSKWEVVAAPDVNWDMLYRPGKGRGQNLARLRASTRLTTTGRSSYFIDACPSRFLVHQSNPNMINLMKRKLLPLFALAALIVCPAFAADGPPAKAPPVKIIFDTDIGNDVDDALALSVLHALQTRGDCELLAVTITKPSERAGPFVDAMNTFYGRPDLPIGCIPPQSDAKSGRFLALAEIKDGDKLRYPHDLMRGSDAPEATELLRKILSGQPDQSVVIVQVGFSSNLAALLGTPGDAVSPLPGRELVKQKVKLLSIMAGAFQTVGYSNRRLEYNVVVDIASAKKLAQEWPTPIVWSGYEIGRAVPYPAVSIERDYGYVAHHPAAEAYYLYKPPPHNRPTWDLTSVLYAVFPDRGYFDLSAAGQVTVEDDGFTRFTPKAEGRDRFLILDELQIARVKEALVQLASQPPR